MGSILDILSRLDAAGVEFVIVGGMAGVAHGSTMVTEDLDLCAPLDDVQLQRLHAVMAKLGATYRKSPGRPTIPSEWTAWRGFHNLYLQTDLGQLDVLDKIEGLGDYRAVRSRSVLMDVGGVDCAVLSIDALIDAKRALGRAKDLQAATELAALRERGRQSRRGAKP